MKRTRFGKDLLKIILLIPLFAKLTTVHRCHGILWLAFFVEVALILVGVRVAITFFIVVILMRKAIAFLFFLINPS